MISAPATDPHDRSPEIVGDPPTLVRGDGELSADAVRLILAAPSRGDLLEKLGITGEDRAELEPLIDAAIADPEVLAAVTRATNLLRDQAGLDAPHADLGQFAEEHHDLEQRLHEGEGLIEILALVAGTDTVRAWHTARGYDAEASWRVLSDLGQQMRVHRASSGRLGLHQIPWCALNWAGQLMWLGRLQFDLHRVARSTGHEHWVLGTHIPATGPLDPQRVEDSFAAATAFAREHYADLDAAAELEVPAFGHEFHCESWLVNAQLPEILGTGSNLGAFAARWEITATQRGDNGAAFFVFGVRPPYDPAALPRTTRLERAVAERLADGRGWRTGDGVLTR